MLTIHVTDINGEQHQIQGTVGMTLMEILRDYDFGIAALCGGACSCATCHVYVDPEWVDRLPERQSDELDVLESTTIAQQNSRLSCQIRFTEAMNGIKLTVAPEE